MAFTALLNSVASRIEHSFQSTVLLNHESDLDQLEARASESLRLGRVQEAAEMWARALQLREQEDQPNSSALCRCLDNLGRAQWELGQLDKALEHHQRAMDLRADRLGDSHLEVAISLDHLATVRSTSGDFEQAETLLRQSLFIRRSQLLSDHPLVAESYFRLARIDLHRNQPLEAEQKLVGVVEIRRRAFGCDHEDSLAALFALVDFYTRAERPLAIGLLANQWLAEARRTAGSTLGRSALVFARAYRSLGCESEASPLLVEAEGALSPLLSDDDPELLDLLEHCLANALALDRLEEGERILLSLLQCEQAAFGVSDPRAIRRLEQVANLAGALGKKAEAVSYFDQCLEAAQLVQKEDPSGFAGPDLEQMVVAMADLEAQLGRPEQVETRLRQLLALQDAHQGKSSEASLKTLIRLADLNQSLGRAQDAEAYGSELVERGRQAGEHGPVEPELVSGFRRFADMLAVSRQQEGRIADAEDLYWLLIRHLENVAPADAPRASNIRERLLRLLLDQERLYLEEGQLEEAEAALEKILDLRSSAAEVSLSALVSETELLAAVKCILGKEEQAEALFGSVGKYGDLAFSAAAEPPSPWLEVLDRHGKIDQAAGLIEAALEGDSPDPKSEDTDSDNHGLWAARLWEFKGDLDRTHLFHAEACYREGLEIRKRILGDRHGSVGTSLAKLAALYADEGRFEAALRLYRQALEIQQACSESLAEAIEKTLRGLAEVCSDLVALPEAEEHYRAAVKKAEEAYGTDSIGTAKTLTGLARVLREQGQSKEAERLLRRVFKTFEELLPADHPQVATSALRWAEALCDLDDFESAEPLLRRALAIRKRGESDADVGRIYNQLGLLEMGRGDAEAAHGAFDKASTIYRPMAETQPLEWAALLANIAELELREARPGQAIELLGRAVAIRKRDLGPEDPLVALTWWRLAQAHRQAGDPGEAERLLGRAVKVLERQPARPLDSAIALDQLADLCCEREAFELAEPLYRRSLEIREVHAGPESLEAAYSHFGLATSHRFRGNRESAWRHFCRCKEIWRRASAYGLLAEADRRWSRPIQETST